MSQQTIWGIHSGKGGQAEHLSQTLLHQAFQGELEVTGNG